MAQFKDNRELTMASIHSNENKQFCMNQPDSDPPGIMEVEASGKYVDEKNNSKKIKGTLKITEWIKSEKSQDPDLYPITKTWYSQKNGNSASAKMFPRDIRIPLMIPIDQSEVKLDFRQRITLLRRRSIFKGP